MNTTHKDYTTKQQKLQFITWLIDKYGYHVNTTTYNARILHEEYLQDKLIDIPQLSIHRWITKLNSTYSNKNTTTTHQRKNNNENIIQDCVNTYALHYISEQITQVPNNILKQ